MKKTFIFVVLLLSLFAYKVNASPNTGALPENGVKVNFNANGSYNSIEGDGWMVDQHPDSLMLTKGDVVIHLMHYVFNDGEIVGFHWMVEGATAVLWVKHGTTTEVYGDGTEGDFLTSDNKQISNVVFLIEIVEDEDEDDDEELDDEDEDDDDDEELDDEDEDDDEEEELDDEEEQDDEEEELDDEEEELDDEVLGDDDEDEEENVDEDEDEVLGEEEESLPDTSDTTAGVGLMAGLLGFFLLLVSKKKNTVTQ
jgi:hypothetical protein